MNYMDGQQIRVGDTVKLWGDCHGVVVASFDTGEFSEEFGKEWNELKEGVLIRTNEVGLVHVVEPNEELVLVQRQV
jgi:hypothetical protein